MTKAVNIAEAKARLSALVDRAAAGEEITLCRAGRPVARLVPLAEGVAREAGVRWDWNVPDELFLEPAEEADLAAAEGSHTDAPRPSRTSSRW
jgi:prevent-host-death family protein